MQVEICDCCADVIKFGDVRAMYPVYTEGKPNPGTVILCNKCALTVSDVLRDLEDLPDTITLPIKTPKVVLRKEEDDS